MKDTWFYPFRYPPPQPGVGASEQSPQIGEVGGKALSLIETTRAGFEVPDGFVLSVSFFQPWLDAIKRTPEWKKFAGTNADDTSSITKEQCDSIKSACKSLTLDQSQKDSLNTALVETFGKAKEEVVVAVRSSSPEEDLSGTSFAGGYETSLGVNINNKTLLKALVTSFESVFDYRVIQYKKQIGLPVDDPRIAVIVQRQLTSDSSGVAFSLNPQNNCYDEAVISANFGLGESVVAGIVTPDTFVVDKVGRTVLSKCISTKEHTIKLAGGTQEGGGTCQVDSAKPEEPALTDAQILRVADLVAKVEEFRGGKPVDIEWALEDDKLYLLQSRPVTAFIPIFPEIMTSAVESKNLYLDVLVFTQGFSEPMSPLGLDIWATMLQKARPHIKSFLINVRGRQYVNLSRFMNVPGGKRIVEKIYKKMDPELGRTLEKIDLDEYVSSIDTSGVVWGVFWMMMQRIFRIFRGAVTGWIHRENSFSSYLAYAEEIQKNCRNEEYLAGISFAETVDKTLDQIKILMDKAFALVTPMFSRWRIHRLFAGNYDAEKLLIYLCMDLDGNPTSEMGHAMVKLASFAEIQETQTSEDFLRGLKDGTFSKEFLEAYDDYMMRFGCRVIKEIDAATPRTYEKQDELFDHLKQIDIHDNATKNVMERRNDAYEKLLAMATEMGKAESFKYHADIVAKMGGYREHPKYMIVTMTDFLRRRALQIGHRFVEEGRLEHTEDIFFLDISQVALAESDGSMDILSLVRKQKQFYAEVEHVKNWPKVVDSRGKIFRGTREDVEREEGVFVGDPISPGVARGKAKVLQDPYEKPLEHGEILVARASEPSWTPIFINAEGVVLEVGGPLQHGAIIAREYGIPCVSGVDNATAVIRDGDLLEVDGSNGTVVRLGADEMDKQTEGEMKAAHDFDKPSSLHLPQ